MKNKIQSTSKKISSSKLMDMIIMNKRMKMNIFRSNQEI